MSTNVPEFIHDLRDGVFESKVSKALSDAAGGVIDNGGSGKVTLTFDIKNLAENNQVMITHKVSASVPTKNGKHTDEDTTTTPMFVNEKGDMTIFPENQTQMFGRKGEPAV